MENEESLYSFDDIKESFKWSKKVKLLYSLIGWKKNLWLD